MLRKIRITLAILFFIGITLLFLDFTGTVHAWLGWMAKVQFLPAILATNVIVVISLLILTWIFGRIYCSVICPLGVLQDIFSWFGSKNKKNRFTYSKGIHWLRYGILGIFILAMIAGVSSIVTIFAPYSTYGLIANNLFAPIWKICNNGLAYIAEHFESYTFYETEIWIKSLPTFIIAIVFLILLFILAWRNGRTYCNTICPVGTLLGFISKYAWFRPVIDTDKCNSCGLCARNCKSSCIDNKNHRIDYSRCVACMDCINKCKKNAISYTHPSPNNKNHSEKNSESRRNFMTSVAILTAAGIKAQEKKVDGGLATIEKKRVPERSIPIVPPGAVSIKNMNGHCTGCQLCVSVCPTDVLRPSTGWSSLLQPESSYERGYCRPECTKCSEVCPAGAIRPISIEEKSSTQIGHAVWIKENCVPLTDDVDCGNCARHCPTGAIQMIPSDPKNKRSRKIPAIDVERCIGCGACENLCPARPFSAIYVEGHEIHKTI